MTNIAQNKTFNANGLFNLKGKTAIVTGAARGIGRAVAEGLASVGVSMTIADALQEELGQTQQAITQADGTCMMVQADLCKTEDLNRLFKQSLAAYGRIDILVNCAGITRSAPSETYTDEDWTKTLDVNLTSSFRLCRLVAKDMISRRSGVIINFASIGAILGFPNNPAYQASKGGLLQLSRALATDWAKYNIRVNTVCPGYTRTAMTEKSYSDPRTNAARASRNMLNRWANPEEMVGPVIFLASEAASYITGSELLVDGGWGNSGLTESQL
jgi:NAD(P)-dependent dehydrogenase (short-subunit alcohol dehydrogenase family)